MPSIIILAAGHGTRMKSSTPKVMHCIAGKPLIEHVITTARSLNPDQIILVIGPELEHITFDSDITTVTQQERKGTGHAVQLALPQLHSTSDNTIILFGDTPLIQPQTLSQQNSTLNDNLQICVSGFRPQDPTGYGRLIETQNKEITHIIEHKDATEEQRKNNLCNGGIIAIRTACLRELIEQLDNNNSSGEYYLTDLIRLGTERNYAATYQETTEQEIMGINTKAQLAQAEAELQTKLRNQALENGVTLVDPNSVFLSTDTKIGKDVIIHPFVTIGEGVTIADNVTIKSFCHIEQAVIGEGATIGPYARLRPGTELADNTHIGNFVEVKNAQIGQGSKINHLSYIGDSTVGNQTNIGAGTITCNYDGKTKHRTTIGNENFIGSNTIFIAPVTTGHKVTTGAGSIITEDIKDNSLAIARSKQENKHKKPKTP